MYDAGHKHFYMNEFARDKFGQLFVPKRWVVKNGILCADALTVSQNDDVSYYRYYCPAFANLATSIGN